MSEIAKCPVCGHDPNLIFYPPGEEVFRHCGVEITHRKQWNQYAAAMELAKKLKELSQCDINTQHAHVEKQVEAAERRVLEVFK